MITFQQLNTHSTTSLAYLDNRESNVIFNKPVAQDLDFTALTFTFTLQRSIDIVEIVKPDVADVEFVIDVSAVSGATVNWASIPAGLYLTDAGGVYTISNIDTVEQWNEIKNPTVSIPTSFEGNFFYTCSINYTTNSGRQSKSWQVGTFIPTSLMASQSTMSITARRYRGFTKDLLAGFFIPNAELEITGVSGANQTDWLADQLNDIDNAPLIVADDLGYTWYYAISPSTTATVDGISVNASVPGLAQSYNDVTKTRTLIGTKSQVNTAVAALRFDASTTKEDFTFNYSVYNSNDPATVYARTQPARCMNLQRLTDARGTASYVAAVESLVGTSSPIIYDPDYTGVGTYTLTITPAQPAAITNITSTGLTKWGVEQSYVDPSIAHSTLTGGKFISIGYGSNFTTAIMGIPSDDTNSTDAGSAYWFTKSENTWTNVKIAYGTSSYLRYGDTVLMADDDTAIISGWGYNTSSPNDPIGRVYVYTRGTGNAWNLAQTLSPPGNNQDAWFGYNISSSRNGDVLAIAEPTDNASGENRLGRVHIYTRIGTGSYSLATTISDPESDYNTSFAWSQCRLHPNGNALAVTDGLGVSDDTYFYSYNGSSWALDTSLSNQRRYVQWIPNTPYRYVYTSGTSIYVMSKSGSSYVQTTVQTLTQTMHSAEYLRFSYNGNRAIVQIDGAGTIYTDRTFLLLDFDDSLNTFTENRIIDVSSYFQKIYDFQINDTGNEIIFCGELTNGSNGFITYTFGNKPNDFNVSTKTLTIEGIKSEVNADIDTVKITTTAGNISNLTFNVSVVTPEAYTQTKQFIAQAST